MTALIALVVAMLSAAGLLYVCIYRPPRLHVVEIDRFGQPGRIEIADETYSPDEAQVGYLIAHLVELVRERPLDPVVLRKNWQKAYHFLAGDAVVAMNNYAREHSGLSSGGGRLVTRTVEITSVLAQSPKSYRVHWIETQYVSGVVDRRKPYIGTFDVTLTQPRDEAELFRNPLGLYVVSFQWTRDFVPLESDAKEAQAQTNETSEKTPVPPISVIQSNKRSAP